MSKKAYKSPPTAQSRSKSDKTGSQRLLSGRRLEGNVPQSSASANTTKTSNSTPPTLPTPKPSKNTTTDEQNALVFRVAVSQLQQAGLVEVKRGNISGNILIVLHKKDWTRDLELI